MSQVETKVSHGTEPEVGRRLPTKSLGHNVGGSQRGREPMNDGMHNVRLASFFLKENAEMSRKVTVKLELTMTLDMEEGVKVSEALSDWACNLVVTDTEEYSIRDCLIENFDVLDSR